MSSETRCSVVGLGKLGSCVAAFLASRGCRVIGVDVDAGVVARLNEGRTHLQEPGLAETLATHRGRLRATSNYHEAIHHTDVTFIVVQTPSESSGAFSLAMINQAIRGIAEALRTKTGYHLVVLTSTILPGSTDHAIQPTLEGISGKRCGETIGFCYNPAFISLGSVLDNLATPDFVLIGESDERAGEYLSSLYRQWLKPLPPIARMSPINAELTKLSVNTYVTTKISFANMLAQLCQSLPGADVDVVTSALGLDARIGRRYLTGAVGYGGPCFPRDNQALSALAKQLGGKAALAETTDAANRAHNAWLLEQLRRVFPQHATIGIFGVAYKPATDVIEESTGSYLARQLGDDGFQVVIYDPHALPKARQLLGSRVRYAENISACLRDADGVVITLPCDEFKRLEASDFPNREHPYLVVDCWRILREKLAASPHIAYLPVGIGMSEADSTAASHVLPAIAR